MTFDVTVIGLGGMGSAAAANLAARGKRVLGLDQFTPPHDQGSSHGQNRVVRQAYYEDPAYVPLLLRAYELWDELGLLTRTGGLMIGRPESEVVAGSLRSARQYNLPHELLDCGEIRRRFPAFTPDKETVALFEANAGFVSPEETVRAHLERAAQYGAELRFGEKITKLPDGPVVITAGAWVKEFVPWPVRIERQVQFWFEPTGDLGAMPIWIWETEDGRHPYGLPAMEGAAKVAFHHGGGENRFCTPATVERSVHDEEVEAMRACLRERIPKLPGKLREAKTCLYTTTPDGHFIIERVSEKILAVSPCSGHGFKFVPLIGEIVADLVCDGRTRHDIGLFSLSRLC
jgi:sarcosine oxidase